MVNGNHGALMPPEAEGHLQAIKDEFIEFVDGKYRAGQKEHGGLLAERTDIQLVHAILEEAVDLVTYAMTLKKRIVDREKT